MVRTLEAEPSRQNAGRENDRVEGGVRCQQGGGVDPAVESHVHPRHVDPLGEVTQGLVELFLAWDELRHVELSVGKINARRVGRGRCEVDQRRLLHAFPSKHTYV